MTSVVLDASALIALLRREPGMEIVRSHLSDAVISAVNYSEVLKKTIERGGSPEPLNAFAQEVSLTILPFDAEQAATAAMLYPLIKPFGLSLADRVCLSLGVHLGAEVLTTEKYMAETAVQVKVRLIRGER